jgi:3-oxoacyl-[acyl-carrier protein] reductase
MADLSKEEEIQAMAEVVKNTFGRLNILINNAAVTVDRLLLRLDEEHWDRLISVNLTGPFLVIKHCLVLMPEGAHIINILSRSGLKGRRGQAAYSASKAGLLGLTKALAKELAHRGIRVNAIVPGYMTVGMGARAPEAMKRAREESVLGTLGNDEDVLRLVKVLIESKGITGQVFVADTRPY